MQITHLSWISILFFSYFFNTNECFLVQCKPYQTKYPWDQLKWSVNWAFWLSEVFILLEYVHVRTKKKFLFLRISVWWVFGLHYINLFAGLWRKKWTYGQTLNVYVCISGLWFKNAHVEKVHGKVFVSKKWFKWLNVKVI